MVRYGYIWSIATLSGGGTDANTDPIQQTKTWKTFLCDAQPSTGRYMVNQNGDKIEIAYLVFAMPNQGIILKRGGLVKDHEGIERTILSLEYNTFTV